MIQTYTPEQIAEIYQVSTNTVYKLINEGKISAKKLGRIYRIPQTEVMWVETGIDYDLRELEKVDEQNLTETDFYSIRDELRKE